MKGYLSKACRKGSKRDFSCRQMVTPRNRKNIYNLEEVDNTASDDKNSIYYVHKTRRANPLKVEMKVNNQNINFKVDTDSGITLISETTNHEKFSN